jgi:hypothetical protein
MTRAYRVHVELAGGQLATTIAQARISRPARRLARTLDVQVRTTMGCVRLTGQAEHVARVTALIDQETGRTAGSRMNARLPIPTS